MSRLRVAVALVVAVVLVGGVEASGKRQHMVRGVVKNLKLTSKNTGVLTVTVHHGKNKPAVDRTFAVTDDTRVQIVTVEGKGKNRKVVERDPGHFTNVTPGTHVLVQVISGTHKAAMIAVVHHVK